MSHIKELTRGIFKENPTFIIMLGMCPTLGVSTQVSNAIGMGASVIFVLTCSNIFAESFFTAGGFFVNLDKLRRSFCLELLNSGISTNNLRIFNVSVVASYYSVIPE